MMRPGAALPERAENIINPPEPNPGRPPQQTRSGVIDRIKARAKELSDPQPAPRGKFAAVEAWATEQLANGADPDYVRGMKLAKLTQPSDPRKRSTIGLHDDDDGPASLGHSHGLTR